MNDRAPTKGTVVRVVMKPHSRNDGVEARDRWGLTCLKVFFVIALESIERK